MSKRDVMIREMQFLTTKSEREMLEHIENINTTYLISTLNRDNVPAKSMGVADISKILRCELITRCIDKHIGGVLKRIFASSPSPP